MVVVEEENGEQAEGERRSQAMGLLGGCDPREWFSGGAGFHAEETTTGRRGGQELALLGEGMERERERERGEQREGERENSNPKTLFSKDCSVGSFRERGEGREGGGRERSGEGERERQG